MALVANNGVVYLLTQHFKIAVLVAIKRADPFRGDS